MYDKMICMKKIITLIFGLLLSLSVYAQSADVITDILETKEATFGQVCYIAAVQQNLIEEYATYDDAVQALYENQIIPSLEEASAPIPAVDLAYIFARLWNVQGGLMFRITKGSPRYAFKQFQSDGIIDSEADPAKYVTGAKALSIYTSCVNKYSGFDMKAVSMEAE